MPTFKPPQVETIYEEKNVHTESTDYNCSVKPYQGQTYTWRDQQAQQALVDSYNAKCK